MVIKKSPENDQDRPLYNSRIIEPYIKLILKAGFSQVDVNNLLTYAQMQPYEVADQGHWFSQNQVDRFYERVTRLTGNSNIARDAGRFAASPGALGVMQQYLLSLLGPARVFRLVNKAAANFTRSASYQARRINRNKIEIRVTPNAGVKEKSFQCENRKGFFEAILMMFNYRLPDISHPECLFEGDAACRYIISWQDEPAALWQSLRNYLIAALLLGNLALLPFAYPMVRDHLAPTSILLALLVSLIAARSEKKALRNSLQEIWSAAEDQVSRINTHYNNAQLASEIGQVISSKIKDGLLDAVASILEKRLDFDRGMVLMANSERTQLQFRAGYGYTEEQKRLLEETAFHLDRPESQGPFIVAFRDQTPLLINDVNVIEGTLSLRSLALIKMLGSRAFICCPIICEGKSVGLLAVDNRESKRPLVQSDISLLMGIAPIIGISIHNAELLQTRSQQFQSTLKVLAASIDARDYMTAGHSEKVTEYTDAICQAMNLSPEFSEMMRVAALLHDYGKIGVPDFILKKPGRLSSEEQALVQTHPGQTREILERIHFEGIYRQIPEICWAHHEKMDGSGYPRGLQGDEIPLGSRIIAVADFFEAITSKRHYRDPMPFDIALNLLQDVSGSHLDPEIVTTFIRYFTTQKACPVSTQKPLDHEIQRRQLRIACRTQVSCRALNRTFSGTSAYLSTSGMYVAMDGELDEGSLLDIVFALPEEANRLVRAKARVVWVNDHSQRPAPSLPVGFGLEFLEIQHEARHALEDFIHHAQKCA